MLSFTYFFKCRRLFSVYNGQLPESQFRPTTLEYMILFIAAYEKGFGLVLFVLQYINALGHIMRKYNFFLNKV